MKNVLIICPHFPPINSADSQRVRMSLPYFKEYGWNPEVVMVDESFSDLLVDEMLMESLPQDVVIHKVKAFDKKITSKMGLGSLALRSMYFYYRKVNQLLRRNKYDLIYFSTTEFPICVLGAYWKNKFSVPFVIDMQDPWYSDYYEDKPKNERPKKYWFSRRLHQNLEPKAMKAVDGLISVSQSYLDVLVSRYPRLQNIVKEVITFGAFDIDFEIAEKHKIQLPLNYNEEAKFINIVYVGRGGNDMANSVKLLFDCFDKGLKLNPEKFGNIRFHFIGTSYAPKGTGKPTLVQHAQKLGLESYVRENTDRIGFYQAMNNLKSANGLLIIGSEDVAYNASKLYPYILAKKNLLAIFNGKSSAAKIIKTCNAGYLLPLEDQINDSFKIFDSYIDALITNQEPKTNWAAFEPYTAKSLTKMQTDLFNQVILTKS